MTHGMSLRRDAMRCADLLHVCELSLSSRLPRRPSSFHLGGPASTEPGG